MEIKNAFQELVNITENRWYDLQDLAVMCGFQLKLVGIDWTSSDELSKIMIEMVKVGFMDINPSNIYEIKIKDEWYDCKQT